MQIKPDDYYAAIPDPVAQFSQPVCHHMNDDHADTIPPMVRHQVGIQVDGAKMLSVDKLGFDVDCTVNGESGVKLRLMYPEPAETRGDVKDRIVQMTKEAKH